MKMNKRLCILLLCAILLLAVLPKVEANAAAVASGTCGGKLTWVLTEDGTLTISGTGEMKEHILPWKDKAEKIRKVVIEEGAASIGSSAFEECKNLISVSIPEGVTSIGSYAFHDCESLTSVIIPEGITCIDNGTFSGCESLTAVTIPEGVTSIGNYAFHNCESLTAVTIPEGVTSIDDSAFYGCKSLTAIAIPEGVTSIGEYTFDGCESLTVATIPEGVTSIGKSAFYGCKSLTAITIPEGVTRIRDNTFSLCSDLETVTLPAGITEIGDDAFNHCKKLKEIELPDGVTAIGNAAFTWCEKLETVVIPDSVRTIGDEAFFNCNSLKKIAIPEGVTHIGEHTFGVCTSLTEITLPDSLISIDDVAFSNCNAVELFTIPANVTQWGERVFSYCSWLNIKMTGSAPDTCTKAFSNSSATVYYPAEDATWTEAKRQEFGGYITWKPYCTGEHTVVTDDAVAATCTETGLTEGSHCSACGEIMVDQEMTEALGHSWCDWYVTKEATTTRDGEQERVCDTCGEIETQTIPANPFLDVEEGAYYYEAVRWALTNDITKGLSANSFGPDVPCTRGQIVTFLWRAAGEPAPQPTRNPFTDVTAEDYCYAAVLWAVEKGITTGLSSTQFGPNEICNRAQVATFLHRYAEEPAPAGENPFMDVNADDYFYDAVLWAVETEITNGYGLDNVYAPQVDCTRGQIVTFLYRAIAK